MNPRARGGFTLVELLVVIAIIGVLVALLLPAVQAAREAANRMSCGNNLKQTGIMVHNFHDTQRRLPYNGDEITNSGCCYATGVRQWSWIARSLPYMEQQPLYDQMNIANGSMDLVLPLFATVLPTLRCPSDDGSEIYTDRANFPGGTQYSGSSYKGVAGSNWAWGTFVYTPPTGGNNGLDAGNGFFYRRDVFKGKRRLAIVTDGLSNTLMVGEDLPARNVHSGWAYSNHATGTCAIPLNNALKAGQPGYNNAGDWPNVYSFRSRHPGGAQFCMGDGAVKFVSETIDINVYRNASSVGGGEVAQVP